MQLRRSPSPSLDWPACRPAPRCPACAATVDAAASPIGLRAGPARLAAQPGLLNLTGGTEFSDRRRHRPRHLNQLITWTAAEDLLAEAGLEPTRGRRQITRGPDSNAPRRAPQDMKDEVVREPASIGSLSPLGAIGGRSPRGHVRREPRPRRVRCACATSWSTPRPRPTRAGGAGGGRRLRRAGQGALDRAGRRRPVAPLAANDGNACHRSATSQTTSSTRTSPPGRWAATDRRAHGAGPEPVRLPRHPRPARSTRWATTSPR